jgi:alkanesulfonate monooxygenase SsuD/methylene tetrahydromethanopterin reductase-like flavin-dependent oxidoreductase (luciferase family)
MRLLPSLFLPEDEKLNMKAIGRGERRKTEVEEPWNWGIVGTPEEIVDQLGGPLTAEELGQEVVNEDVGEHQGDPPC